MVGRAKGVVVEKKKNIKLWCVCVCVYKIWVVVCVKGEKEDCCFSLLQQVSLQPTS